MRRVVSHQMRAWGQGVEGGRGLIWAFSSLPVAFQSFLKSKEVLWKVEKIAERKVGWFGTTTSALHGPGYSHGQGGGVQSVGDYVGLGGGGGWRDVATPAFQPTADPPVHTISNNWPAPTQLWCSAHFQTIL